MSTNIEQSKLPNPSNNQSKRAVIGFITKAMDMTKGEELGLLMPSTIVHSLIAIIHALLIFKIYITQGNQNLIQLKNQAQSTQS